MRNKGGIAIYIRNNITGMYRVYQKKGNLNLACYCALITACMNLIFE